ncbi:MAG: family 2 glycosyl transferase [Parcubacteria group bacterium LiPW_30]|nr:MAG: family 2 glycosyl transferase [Parcubacteria group bacterium LiPW_30]
MKFSIVTPVYNGEKYIAQTIESVLSQEGNFEIEYIIQDGGSTDNTLFIIKKYEEMIKKNTFPIKCHSVELKYCSEKDSGMYDAINKGFGKATGEIFAYINSDDLYLPGAFYSVVKILNYYPEIDWLKGINSTIKEGSNEVTKGECFIYRRKWLRSGIYGRSAYFIQQDSVFWKKSLWNKRKINIDSFRLAGDYALWVEFAKHTPLFSFNKQVSIFRKHYGQLSESMDEYRKEQEKIAPHLYLLEKKVVLFFSLIRLFKIPANNISSKILFFCMFPLYKKEWYIDFDKEDKPVKKLAETFTVTEE